MKKLSIFLTLALIFVAGVIFNIPPVEKTEATFTLPHVTICHKQDGPDVTISVSLAALGAHLAHGDHLGACQEVTPTPTPTVEPSVTPTVTPDPCDEQAPSEVLLVAEVDPCITPTPTEEPELTPTPTATPSAGNPPTFAGSSTETPVCSDPKPTRVANINVVTTGNPGELEVQWALPIGGDRVHIEYGLQKYAEHALLNTPNDGSEIIRDLKSGEHYWFRVFGVNGCAVGDPSDWFDPLVP